MRTMLACLAVLVVALGAASLAQAQHPFPSHPHHGPSMPNAFAPWPCHYPTWGGNAFVPQPPCRPDYSWFQTWKHCPPGPPACFPQHPFARSPRDFFMYEW